MQPRLYASIGFALVSAAITGCESCQQVEWHIFGAAPNPAHASEAVDFRGKKRFRLAHSGCAPLVGL